MRFSQITRNGKRILVVGLVRGEVATMTKGDVVGIDDEVQGLILVHTRGESDEALHGALFAAGVIAAGERLPDEYTSNVVRPTSPTDLQ